MGRKGQSITLSVSESEKRALEKLALKLGMRWGDRPNISRLIVAIAHQELRLHPHPPWNHEEIAAIRQAIRILSDAGYTNDTLILARLLLESSHLMDPLRTEIEKLLAQPPIPWRLELQDYIQRQIPFQLAYCDAAERAWTFTIRHARFQVREYRQYLECWCEETDGSRDLPELQHNRCLRLDRIPDAALHSVRGNWQPGLDQIPVELHLSGGLSYAYEARVEDVSSDRLSEFPKIRRVVRRVSNTFWLLREVLSYGDECVIVSPVSLQERLRQKVRSLLDQYANRLP